MSDDYSTFLARKVVAAPDLGVDIDDRDLHQDLFDFQRVCVRFALRKGRAALFLDTGLGKTRCQLEFCRHAIEKTGRPALILAPLAVAHQIDREGRSIGYDCRVIRDAAGVLPGINICNYDRLDLLNPAAFGCVSLDESGILRSFTGKTSRALRERFVATPFRLCASATPAPNDHTELGQHSSFLGVLPSAEMLSRWFIADQTQMGNYRLKKHGEADFWAWVSSWSRMAVTPDDLGFDGSRFVLPPLRVVKHSVNAPIPKSATLFGDAASATGIYAAKKVTASARAEKVAEIVAAEPGEAWVVWCDTDAESASLAKMIGGDCVEVKGALPADEKERRLMAFADGEKRIIVTKPSIAGFGLNWQHAARVAFVGRTFSYAAYYQAVRRCWRFGQMREVIVNLVMDQTEVDISRLIDCKAEQHGEMKLAMSQAMRRGREEKTSQFRAYLPDHKGKMPSWLSA